MKRKATHPYRLIAAAAAVICGVAATVSFASPSALAVEPEETEVSGKDWIDGVYPVQYAAIEIDVLDAERVSSPAPAQTAPAVIQIPVTRQTAPAYTQPSASPRTAPAGTQPSAAPRTAPAGTQPSAAPRTAPADTQPSAAPQTEPAPPAAQEASPAPQSGPPVEITDNQQENCVGDGLTY